MGALPSPVLPPGAHHDLVRALHELHHEAGWPSLRSLARHTGVSHTTVSKVLSSSVLPPWGTVELLVEAMGGSRRSSTPSGSPRRRRTTTRLPRRLPGSPVVGPSSPSCATTWTGTAASWW